MKAYIIILVSLLAITFLWRFMILAGIIWLVLRFIAREYIKFKYKGEDEYVSKWNRS